MAGSGSALLDSFTSGVQRAAQGMANAPGIAAGAIGQANAGPYGNYGGMAGGNPNLSNPNVIAQQQPNATNGITNYVNGAANSISNYANALPAYTAAAAGPSFSDIYNQMFGMASQQSAAHNAMLDAVNNQLQGRIGIYGANYQQQGQSAADIYNLNAQLLQQDANNNATQLAAAQRQNPLIDQLWKNDYGYLTGAQQRAADQMYSRDRAYNAQLAYLGQQWNQNEQGYGLTADRLQQANTMQKFGIGSDATGRGAGTSLAAQLGFQNADKEYQNQLSQAGLQRDQTRSGIQNQDTQTHEAMNQSYGSYLDQNASLQHQIDNGYQQMVENKAQNADKIATLNNQANSYGVQAQKLYAMYQQGIQQLNLDQYMTADKLLDMMNSNNMDKVALAENISRSALDAASQMYSGAGGNAAAAQAYAAPSNGFTSFGMNGSVTPNASPVATGTGGRRIS